MRQWSRGTSKIKQIPTDDLIEDQIPTNDLSEEQIPTNDLIEELNAIGHM